MCVCVCVCARARADVYYVSRKLYVCVCVCVCVDILCMRAKACIMLSCCLCNVYGEEAGNEVVCKLIDFDFHFVYRSSPVSRVFLIIAGTSYGRARTHACTISQGYAIRCA